MYRLVCLCAFLILSMPVYGQASIKVGSKNFAESYILAEVFTQLLQARGFDAEHIQGLGGTLITYQALVDNQIQVYPEYTGTIFQAILKQAATDDAQAQTLLQDQGLAMLAPLGFNNTYALATTRQQADAWGVTRLSQLSAVGEIRAGLSLEFLHREDGWPGLAARYQFAWQPKGIEHALAYDALLNGDIEITDAYSTDGELSLKSLVLLEDDLGYFPGYLALPLINHALSKEARAVLGELASRIDESRMQQMNARLLQGASPRQVAADFLHQSGLVDTALEVVEEESTAGFILRHSWTHIKLSASALLFACVLAIPLGIALSRRPKGAALALQISGLLQTIPSLALLALLIPLFGLGVVPALIALSLYAVLPVLRNTLTGFQGIDPLLIQVANGMGMTAKARLFRISLPLAMPSILAGVKTAAVISLGTATLAAFVGAGGLGEPIITGLTLNDSGLILQGAVPAACLAVLTEGLFSLLERRLVPAHLRPLS